MRKIKPATNHCSHKRVKRSGQKRDQFNSKRNKSPDSCLEDVSGIYIVDDLLRVLRVGPGHPLQPALQDEFARQVKDRTEPFVQRRTLQVDRQGQHLLSHTEPEGQENVLCRQACKRLLGLDAILCVFLYPVYCLLPHSTVSL